MITRIRRHGDTACWWHHPAEREVVAIQRVKARHPDNSDSLVGSPVTDGANGEKANL